MAPCGTISFVFLSVVLAGLDFCSSSQVYVVYMGSKTTESPNEALIQNHQMLSSVHGGSIEKARESHVYSYSNGFRGFAAKLSKEQASKMAEMPGVVSVLPNLKRNLHTTHSWDFVGLSDDEEMEIAGFSTKNQENVIIGFIDTGIWPESPSFNDEGMPPVPSRWKGKCQTGQSFTNSSCNKKIIGARFYINSFMAEISGKHGESSMNSVIFTSPRDSQGHGSHTASTAAGRLVSNMSYNGLASGRARGGAPRARIAVYKACWDNGCYDADILAAFDDAISDGVDVLSLSLGPGAPQSDYFSDPISIGSFHAFSRGISVVSSAGNDGDQGSATNLAPWMLTVSASSTDRDFASDIVLGNGKKLVGRSLNTFQMYASARTISASNASAKYFSSYQSSLCLDSSLDIRKTRGKIVVCQHSGDPQESYVAKGDAVKKAGGIGMILIEKSQNGVAIPFSMPAATVGAATGDRILFYLNHTKTPRSTIMRTETVVGSRPAPRMTAFSSKGPNSLNPEILKPDIAAPGLNILAAWSPAAGKTKFNIVSGTSMSCPHVSALVALIKSVYPSWSPSAIKSAIMTTAYVLDKRGNPMVTDPEQRVADPFDYGAGFVDPLRILNPGLVYDAQPLDYKVFLCSQGYDDKSLQLVTGDHSICVRPSPTASNLNYPSIAVPDLKTSYSVVRAATNVGKPQSVYRAFVRPPTGINVTVVPEVLVFQSSGQKISFMVNFTVASVFPSRDYVFGSLAWTSAEATATTPLVVRTAASVTGLF